LTAGASAVDVCMNATGHHCGHTSLSEVAMVLEDLYDVRTGIDLKGISHAAAVVNRHSGVPLPLTMPVIGEYAFMGDGAYWAAEEELANEQRVHAKFPFAPGVVGAEERIVWSDRTVTRDAVIARLSSLGLGTDDGLASRIEHALAATLAERRRYPGWLTDAEFGDVCRSMASQTA
jgi:isopropylmalate/homocitrate/citramalate synthase